MGSLESVKLKMGWVGANRLPTCRNCKHGEERRTGRATSLDKPDWYCKKGEYLTSAWASCKEHEQ